MHTDTHICELKNAKAVNNKKVLLANDFMHTHTHTQSSAPIFTWFHGLREEKMFSPLLLEMQKAIKTAPARPPTHPPHSDHPFFSRPSLRGDQKEAVRY